MSEPREVSGMLFHMLPALGKIQGQAVNGFGDGGNFVYPDKADQERLTSDRIPNLRGKSSENNTGSISIVGKGPSARVRFDIPGGGTKKLNARSELATGTVFDKDDRVTIGLRFRVKNPSDLQGFAYLLQGWQPVQAPRFGLRVSTRKDGAWDIAQRGSSFLYTRGLRPEQQWQAVVMDVQGTDGIDWYDGRGRQLGFSKGNFLSPPNARAVTAQVWRPKFGYYGDGSGKPNWVEIKELAIGSRAAVFEAFGIDQ